MIRPLLRPTGQYALALDLTRDRSPLKLLAGHHVAPILGLILALVVTSCTFVEEKRIRELLNEKGFGTRAEGVAPLTNYITGGDGVLFYLDQTAYMVPDAERL